MSNSEIKRRPPLLHQFYRDFLERENSAAFIRSVTSHYTTPALQRLASSPERETRRAAVLALGMTADYSANAALGGALLDEDRAVRLLAESGLRAVWRRQGNAAQRRQIAIMAHWNRSGEYAEAIALGGAVIHGAPWIAEVWSLRGAAYFHQRRYHAALADCNQALELNPYHFAAAIGMAHCHLHLRDRAAALECFKRALRLNPNLEGVRAQVRSLQKSSGL